MLIAYRMTPAASRAERPIHKHACCVVGQLPQSAMRGETRYSLTGRVRKAVRRDDAGHPDSTPPRHIRMSDSTKRSGPVICGLCGAPLRDRRWEPAMPSDWIIEFYRDEDGREPCRQWMEKLRRE